MGQAENGLGFHIQDIGAKIDLTGQLIDTEEEEVMQLVEGGGAAGVPSAIEHFIDLLGGIVVAGVLGIAEAIGVAVKGTGGGQGLIGAAAIDQIHEIGFDPAG